MPWIIAALWTAFRAILPSLVGQALLAVGVAVITTTGVNIALDSFKSQLLDSLHGLPADTVALLGFMKVGVCVSMVFGALAARLTRKGMQAAAGGTLKSFTKK
jgi:hypothetical protein